MAAAMGKHDSFPRWRIAKHFQTNLFSITALDWLQMTEIELFRLYSYSKYSIGGVWQWWIPSLPCVSTQKMVKLWMIWPSGEMWSSRHPIPSTKHQGIRLEMAWGHKISNTPKRNHAWGLGIWDHRMGLFNMNIWDTMMYVWDTLMV